MNYCKNCIMPDTRPDQIFNDKGVCNACLSYEHNQKKINWEQRSKELEKIISEAKDRSTSWDCVIPSSGGKDSTYQALWAKTKGLNPVLVTATTCDLSLIGRKNLDNLKQLGFDTIEISNDPKIRAKLNKSCLDLIGDISWPEHVSIFTAPIKFALNYKIPLILYGENPQIEYGGPEKSLSNYLLDRKWMEEFGGLIGLRVSDLLSEQNFTKKQLSIYEYPTQEELSKFPIKSIFLGYFERWDSLRNFDISKENGFQSYDENLEGCYFNFEKLDNYQHGIHDYFKFLKFGFGRATDQLCYSIRRGLITRKEALKKVKLLEGQYPKSYMGKSISQILNKIGMTISEFNKICDKFTNKKIFKCDQKGHLVKDEKFNLTKNFEIK